MKQKRNPALASSTLVRPTLPQTSFEQFRGHGIGMALLTAVAKLAVEEGCFGLRWEVLDWNHPAIEFYKKLGATFLNERKVVSFDESAMRRVAADSKSF